MRILAIDDTKILRELLAVTIRQAGYEVVEAEDGLQGFSRFDEYKADVVISDLNMPKCDGIEFTRAVRQRPDAEGVPIIIHQAYFKVDQFNGGGSARCGQGTRS